MCIREAHSTRKKKPDRLPALETQIELAATEGRTNGLHLILAPLHHLSRKACFGCAQMPHHIADGSPMTIKTPSWLASTQLTNLAM